MSQTTTQYNLGMYNNNNNTMNSGYDNSGNSWVIGMGDTSTNYNQQYYNNNQQQNFNQQSQQIDFSNNNSWSPYYQQQQPPQQQQQYSYQVNQQQQQPQQYNYNSQQQQQPQQQQLTYAQIAQQNQPNIKPQTFTSVPSLIIPPPSMKKKKGQAPIAPSNGTNFKPQPIVPIVQKPPPQPAKVKANNVGLEKLSQYVARALSSASNTDELTEMEELVKSKINSSKLRDDFLSINWDIEPLPQLKNKQQTFKNSNHKINGNNNNQGKNNLDKKRKKEFSEPQSEAIKRIQRFNNNNNNNNQTVNTKQMNQQYQQQNIGLDGELDWDSLTIKGTCINLEKPYLRLTSAPDPSTVRPEYVLKQSLNLVKKKWKENEDYTYTCEQLRSIRQDLTVQNLKNQLTIDVYETHARIALENNDLGQFNQCQTQLFSLYKQGIPTNCYSEFFSYRILYNVYQDNNFDLTKTLSELRESDKQDPSIQHALKVRTAIYTNNFISFFRLCKNSPNMACYILDKIIPRVRITALKVMVKSYKPNLLFSQIMSLGFINEKTCQDFIRENKLVYSSNSKTEIDCKLSLSVINQLVPPVISVAAPDRF